MKKLDVICGVYKITSPSGKVYVGSSMHILKRWWYYRKMKCKEQVKLYNSFVKYGVDNHIFEVVKECSFEDLFKYERELGVELNVIENGLNLKLPKYGDLKQIISKETRDKRSNFMKGNKFTLGYVPTLETRALLSKIHKGRFVSEDTKAKQALAATGRVWSNESRLKLSNKKKGIKPEKAIKASIVARLGKPKNRESVMKTADALRGVPRTEVVKNKIRLSLIGRFTMGENPNAKIVLNTLTGTFHNSGKEAALAYNINYQKFKTNISKSKGIFIYA
jgi:group I intron endonuclease